MRGQHAGQICGVDGQCHPGRYLHQGEPTAGGEHPPTDSDQQPESDRVAEPHASEVERKIGTLVPGDGLVQGGAGSGHRAQVEFAADGDDHPSSELHRVHDQIHQSALGIAEGAILPAPMDAGLLLGALSDEAQLVHLEVLEGRAARHGDVPGLDPELLELFGVPRLWVHQAEAITLLRQGHSVVVATGTASGKSLAYQLPIVEAASQRGTALAMFPTKALAQDQLRTLHGLHHPDVVAATYDGDTTPEARAWVRRNGSVVLTNPEMLHTGILPYHGRWATFLRQLRYVVVDELHVLRGVFGTHAGHLLRRLRRLCDYYGSDPVFVFTSATIGEPGRLASELCGMPVREVTDDGSPRGPRTVALWNPPLLDEEIGVRASPNRESARIMAALVSGNTRCVTFARSRRATERIAMDVRERVAEVHPALRDTVRSYRAGYLAAERREIEAQLFDGHLLGIVATSALELGVDVGGLDAAILTGFPGTIASMWQQIGRAGRGTQESLAVLVAGNDQLDQWLMAHPREVFSRRPEPAVVNLSNPFVRNPHLACAAYERPLTADDERWWGDDLEEGVMDLVRADRLIVREGAAYWGGRGTPAGGIGLRNGSGHEVRIMELGGRMVGTVDAARASDTVHPGAIYLHQGQQYRVQSLDLVGGEAEVEPVEVDEYTMARTSMEIAVRGWDRRDRHGPIEVGVGGIEVTTQVTGYERRDSNSGEVMERVELELPPRTLLTRACWYVVPDEVLTGAGVDPTRIGGTLHAVEHAAIGVLPLFTICDRWDVGGLSIAMHPDTGSPSIFIYDGYPGGAGIAELAFAARRRHLDATLAVIERCRCRSGCPSCIQSPKCGNGNEPLDKAGAVALLRAIGARPGS